jgi:hypothetical protein
MLPEKFSLKNKQIDQKEENYPNSIENKPGWFIHKKNYHSTQELL